MELKDMTIADIEARIAEMKAEIDSAESAEKLSELEESFKEERTLLAERKAELKDLEERKAMAKEIEEGKKPVSIIEERKEERSMVKIEEYRNSKEYVEAYAEYIKTGKDEEVRSLLTTNVGDAGTIAVPQIVMDEIKTAWESNALLSRISRKFEAAYIAQQFEISGSDAVIHDEGSGAVSEETLSLGIATLTPKEIIKWVSFSKTVMAMRGEAFLQYIYRELSHKIMRAVLKDLIQQIVALPTSATTTTPSAAKIKVGATVGTVSEAFANLSDEAENPVVVINKLTHATLKAAAYANGYGVDPFEGLDVYYNDTLPAYSSATENQVWMIVGDFDFGCVANFPNGDGVDIVLDELTQKKSGMVEACGTLVGGAMPCACKAFTLVTKPAAI